MSKSISTQRSVAERKYSGLPLAARPMFLQMGVGPATSVLGGIACLALPVPFLFMKFGVRLRKLSKFAPAVED